MEFGKAALGPGNGYKYRHLSKTRQSQSARRNELPDDQLRRCWSLNRASIARHSQFYNREMAREAIFLLMEGAKVNSDAYNGGESPAKPPRGVVSPERRLPTCVFVALPGLVALFRQGKYTTEMLDRFTRRN